MSPKTLNKAKKIKFEVNQVDINATCPGLMEQYNRISPTNRKKYKYAAEDSMNVNKKSPLGFQPAPHVSCNLRFDKVEPLSDGILDLKKLYDKKTELNDFTRKYNIASNGHLGHQRKLSTQITFKHQISQLDKD